MIRGDLKRYERYKDSGVEWLGDVPAHWEVKRIKEIATIFNGATPKSGSSENWDGDIYWVTTDDLGKLHTNEICDTKRKITRIGYQSCGTTLCPIGSVVISGRAPIGHLGILAIHACTNQGCKTLVLDKSTNNHYLYYNLLTFKTVLESLGKGTTFIELSTKELSLLKLSCPSYEEQQAIAAYLVEKTNQIDRKIELLTMKADRYRELKQTLINETVTRGLDPNVPMKDSGVEWIGEIPAHWEVKRLKDISTVQTGNTPEKERKEYYKENGFLWVKPDELCEFQEIIYSKETLSLTGKRRTNIIQKGSVLVCCIGSIGKMGVAGVELSTNQQINAITFFKCMLLRFSKYLIYASKEEMIKQSVGNVVQILNATKHKNLLYPIPPHHEQQAIATYLDTKTAQIDRIITTITTQIQTLQELRKTLINDVVTGKIKVV